jgi:hypothetical protein
LIHLAPVDLNGLGAYIPDNAFGGAKFSLGELAALLVDPDNGEEH